MFIRFKNQTATQLNPTPQSITFVVKLSDFRVGNGNACAKRLSNW
jgi:hypothetical protein